MVITAEACELVNKTKAKRTSCSCYWYLALLKQTETAVGTDGMLREYSGWTNKFIFPPFDFGLADCMVATSSSIFYITHVCSCFWWLRHCYGMLQKAANGYMFGCYVILC